MKKMNDFDFIKSKFEEENVTAPYGLDERMVMGMLDGRKQKRVKFYQSKAFKVFVSAAACVAVVLTAVTVVKPYLSDGDVTIGVAPPEQQQVLNTFTSVDEIKSAVKEIESVYYAYSDKGGALVDKEITDAITTEQPEGGAGETSFGDTYTQVDDVDEADIIKNDGEYIYYASTSRGCVKIYKPSGEDAELVSTIDDFLKVSDEYSEKPSDTENVYDIYVYKNILAVNTEKYEYHNKNTDDYYDADVSTLVYLYDISDVTSPKKINSFGQSGTYISSRMIGNQLYLVTNDFIYSDECKDDSDYLPYVCNGKDSEKESIKLSDISYGTFPSESGYLVISIIDVENAKKTTDTKAVFGAGTDMYCNKKNMYITMNEWQWNGFKDNSEHIDTKTQIVKVNFSEGDIKFTAECEVPGNTHNQFSMDEKDGNLRVATTSYNEKGNEVNNLFVLDENLNKIGEVTGFAEDESIKAVRFMGDMAYVITYEETDPLFVIDLSVPTNPQIKGEVKISGFSSLLVPVDENTLLGIGYSTHTGEFSEVTDGVKFALFDISNPQKPAVLDSYVLKYATSDAQYNHHALLVNPQAGYYAIPYQRWDDEKAIDENGVIKIEIENGKINVANNFNIDSDENIIRCTYVNDNLYAFDYSGNVYSCVE
ncbi:MAG TPA: hypothetical protein DD404_05530 [Ruminococcaceae bacterium]|nr:hypothetical protein [Oscillospiraceae bacterium]